MADKTKRMKTAIHKELLAVQKQEQKLASLRLTYGAEAGAGSAKEGNTALAGGT